MYIKMIGQMIDIQIFNKVKQNVLPNQIERICQTVYTGQPLSPTLSNNRMARHNPGLPNP